MPSSNLLLGVAEKALMFYAHSGLTSFSWASPDRRAFVFDHATG